MDLPAADIGGDRAAIERLMFSYAERLDAGDLEGVGALFEHATYGVKGLEPLRGSAAVLAAMREMVRIHEDGTPRTKHVTTNISCDFNAAGTAAEVRSYFTVLQATDELPLQAILAGRYQDQFEKVDGAWRFRSRLLLIDLAGETGQHLSRPLG